MTYTYNVTSAARSSEHCLSLIKNITNANLVSYLGNVSTGSLTDSWYCSELLLFLETWNADSHSCEIELK